MKTYALITLILIIAVLLRIWNLSQNPTGFFVDEASTGLNAYKILTTGKDTHGKPFPVIFEAVGDYRDPVLIYSAVPFIALFGLNEFSVRLVSAFYGIAAVLMMFFVGKAYFNEKVGIWSALLLAISPWHVHFSRVGFQLITSVFWILFTLYFFRRSFTQTKYYLLAAIGFMVTFFTYSTTKMYLPIIIILLMVSYHKEVGSLIRNKFFWSVTIGIILFTSLLIYPSVLDGSFFKRWTQVHQDLSFQEIVVGYVSHFSPQFLFITGDAEFPGQDVKRHSIPGVGELYWFQIPFLIATLSAFIYLAKERKKLFFWMLLLVIYPLGSIFTGVQPQATRSIIGVIPFTILTAYGIEELRKLFQSIFFRRMYYVTLGSGICVSLFLFVVALQNYPLQGADYWGWQYGYRPIMSYFKQHEQSYDTLYVTHRFNMGQELLNFYNEEYQCSKCSVMNNPIKIDPERKELFALRTDDIQEASREYPELVFKQKDVITLPNGNIELRIGEFTNAY